MRLDRGIRVMLERDCVEGREVWAPNPRTGEWIPTKIVAYLGDDKVEVVPNNCMAGNEPWNAFLNAANELRWYVPRYWLRFRDSSRQGRDMPRDHAESPALKPKLKPGQVAKLGILSSGDIVGGQK